MVGDAPVTLPFITNPSDALRSTFVWSSSDEEIATVDKNGLITAHKAGTVTISLTYIDEAGEQYTIKAKLVITESAPTMDVGVLAVKKGKKVQLKRLCRADGTWSVKDENIARIAKGVHNKKVILKTKNVGDTYLLYTVKNISVFLGDREYKSGETISIPLHVLPEKPQVVRKIRAGVKNKLLRLKVGEEYTLHPKIRPVTALYQEVLYKSNNPSVAKVSQDGTITAVKKGRAKITLISTNLKRTTITVKVK